MKPGHILLIIAAIWLVPGGTGCTPGGTPDPENPKQETPPAPSSGPEPTPSPEPPVPTPTPQPQQPSWWPDKTQFPNGMDWPPPRPPGWDPNQAWPPVGVSLEDPQWWIDRFGSKYELEEDGPGENASHGSPELAQSFNNWLECTPEGCEPGCNLFTLVQYSQDWFGCRSGGCSPYPSGDMHRHCEHALDANSAEATCRNFCQRNQRRCRQHRLHTPPMHARWECSEGQVCADPLHQDCGECEHTSVSMECYAYFLCECWEN